MRCWVYRPRFLGGILSVCCIGQSSSSAVAGDVIATFRSQTLSGHLIWPSLNTTHGTWGGPVEATLAWQAFRGTTSDCCQRRIPAIPTPQASERPQTVAQHVPGWLSYQLTCITAQLRTLYYILTHCIIINHSINQLVNSCATCLHSF